MNEYNVDSESLGLDVSEREVRAVVDYLRAKKVKPEDWSRMSREGDEWLVWGEAALDAYDG